MAGLGRRDTRVATRLAVGANFATGLRRRVGGLNGYGHQCIGRRQEDGRDLRRFWRACRTNSACWTDGARGRFGEHACDGCFQRRHDRASERGRSRACRFEGWREGIWNGCIGQGVCRSGKGFGRYLDRNADFPGGFGCWRNGRGGRCATGRKQYHDEDDLQGTFHGMGSFSPALNFVFAFRYLGA